MPENERSPFASSSIPLHLMRGAIGFGLIGAAFVLTPSRGPAALLLAAPGLLALGGCPTCWIAGLVETISAGRLKRTCTEDGCRLDQPTPTTTDEQKAKSWRRTKATRSRAA